MRNFSSLFTLPLLATLSISIFLPFAPGIEVQAKTAPVKVENAIPVSPKSLVSNPAVYLKKNITLQGVVSGFSALGLDYPPVKYESKDYVTLLIYRDDVPESFKIPLSELKLFVDRDVLKEVKHLGQGDTIAIEGKVVSTALGDPWVEVSQLKVLKSVQKDGDESTVLLDESTEDE